MTNSTLSHNIIFCVCVCVCDTSQTCFSWTPCFSAKNDKTTDIFAYRVEMKLECFSVALSRLSTRFVGEKWSTFAFPMASGEGFYLNYMYARFFDNDYVSFSQSVSHRQPVEWESEKERCLFYPQIFYCEYEHCARGAIYQIVCVCLCVRCAYYLEFDRINRACSIAWLKSIGKKLQTYRLAWHADEYKSTKWKYAYGCNVGDWAI